MKYYHYWFKTKTRTYSTKQASRRQGVARSRIRRIRRIVPCGLLNRYREGWRVEVGDGVESGESRVLTS